MIRDAHRQFWYTGGHTCLVINGHGYARLCHGYVTVMHGYVTVMSRLCTAMSRLCTVMSRLCTVMSRVKMNSINWPTANLWVFIAQLVEHCSANAEAMGSNPVDALNFFFQA